MIGNLTGSYSAGTAFIQTSRHFQVAEADLISDEISMKAVDTLALVDRYESRQSKQARYSLHYRHELGDGPGGIIM